MAIIAKFLKSLRSCCERYDTDTTKNSVEIRKSLNLLIHDKNLNAAAKLRHYPHYHSTKSDYQPSMKLRHWALRDDPIRAIWRPWYGKYRSGSIGFIEWMYEDVIWVHKSDLKDYLSNLPNADLLRRSNLFSTFSFSEKKLNHSQIYKKLNSFSDVGLDCVLTPHGAPGPLYLGLNLPTERTGFDTLVRQVAEEVLEAFGSSSIFHDTHDPDSANEGGYSGTLLEKMNNNGYTINNGPQFNLYSMSFEHENLFAQVDHDHDAHKAVLSLQSWQGGKKDDDVYIYGSAVLVYPGVALTASHVIDEFAEKGLIGDLSKQHLYAVLINHEKPEFWKVIWAFRDKKADIALLVMTAYDEMKPTFPAFCVQMTIKPISVGDRLWTTGSRAANDGHIKLADDGKFEGDFALLISSGIVSAVYPKGRDQTMLPGACAEVEMEAIGGMSGGPVFNEDGYLVGVLSTSIASFGEFPPISYVTPIWPMLTQPFTPALWDAGQSITLYDQVSIDESWRYLCPIPNKGEMYYNWGTYRMDFIEPPNGPIIIKLE